MATIPDVDTALWTLLRNDSGVSALTTRIYGGVAPSGSAYPLITFMVVDSGIPNEVTRQTIDYMYRVHSWDTNGADADTLHLAVYSAIHRQTLSVSGWTTTALQVTGGVKMPPEEDGGKTYYHFVWDVRFRASQNS